MPSLLFRKDSDFVVSDINSVSEIEFTISNHGLEAENINITVGLTPSECKSLWLWLGDQIKDIKKTEVYRNA